MSNEEKPLAAGAMATTCANCDDRGWVCENHQDRPWDDPRACTCGGAGAPCPACSVTDEGKVPRMPKAFGWRSTRTAGGTEMPCERPQAPSGLEARRRDRHDAPAQGWAPPTFSAPRFIAGPNKCMVP
jgi:hypothetical protein